MVRTRIHLTEGQHRESTGYSRRAGTLMAEAVRRCADTQLVHHEAVPVEEERIRTALAVCGKYRDPLDEARVAQEHDRHLVEVYRIVSVFADTSGLYALLLGSEEDHAEVVRVFRDVFTTDRLLWSSRLMAVVTRTVVEANR